MGSLSLGNRYLDLQSTQNAGPTYDLGTRSVFAGYFGGRGTRRDSLKVGCDTDAVVTQRIRKVGTLIEVSRWYPCPAIVPVS